MEQLLFTILLAGCPEDSGHCTVLERHLINAPSVEKCERILDHRLQNSSADWPVVSGVCLAGETTTAPSDWHEDGTTVAVLSRIDF